MFCQKCGAEIPDESVSCGACGAKQEEIKEEKTSAEPKKKKVSPEVVLIAVIVAVFAAAFAAIVLFQ